MARYTEAHANPQGAGDARPTALQIVKDEGVEGKLGSKVIVLTGATSGIVSQILHTFSTFAVLATLRS